MGEASFFAPISPTNRPRNKSENIFAGDSPMANFSWQHNLDAQRQSSASLYDVQHCMTTFNAVIASVAVYNTDAMLNFDVERQGCFAM